MGSPRVQPPTLHLPSPTTRMLPPAQQAPLLTHALPESPVPLGTPPQRLSLRNTPQVMTAGSLSVGVRH